jgi:hypothetical protein
VKGDLATVVCEGHTRQIAFDTLAKYNVIKIGTVATGPGQVPQGLTLPILRSLDVRGIDGRISPRTGASRRKPWPIARARDRIALGGEMMLLLVLG